MPDNVEQDNVAEDVTAQAAAPAEEDFVVDTDTSDAVDMGPVPEGEYQLQCLKATGKSGVGKNGPWKGIQLMLDIPDEITANYLNHMVFLPLDSHEPKDFERNKKKLDIFKQAWGFDPSEPFRPSDLEGREAFAYLTVENDDEYGPQNNVKRWVTGPTASGVGIPDNVGGM